VAQQQLGEPVAGAHEVGSGRLAGADQVAGGLLLGVGDPDRHQVPEAQGAGEALGVPPVVLDPVAARSRIWLGAATRQATPACWQARASA
jgi:hypothetical protein